MGKEVVVWGNASNRNRSGIAQTDSVRTGIMGIATQIADIAFALPGVVIMFRYPLHKKEVDDNSAIPSEKHKA